MTPTQLEALKNGVCTFSHPPMTVTVNVIHRLGYEPFHLWQCSITILDKREEQVLTSRWSEEMLQKAVREAQDALYDVGKPDTTNVELSPTEYIVRRRFSEIDLNEMRLMNDAIGTGS